MTTPTKGPAGHQPDSLTGSLIDPRERIVACLGMGVFTVDTDWNLTSFNPEAERITGFCAADVLGRKCFEVFCTEFCNERCHLQRAMRSGRPVVKERVHFLDARQRRVPLEVTASVLRDEAGRITGGVECFVDSVSPLAPDPDEGGSLEDMVGADPSMLRLFETMTMVAATDVGVLLQGETGTGKGLLARAIHQLSPRRDGPFVKINCAALPETLLESELFGYRRGAFTDAKKDKPGMFQQAAGGTLLLDEIGDLPADLQAKLLQALEDKQFRPLGATSACRADARVIAATNRDLAAMAAKGEFRADLFYRLRIVELRVPPLRERPGDLGALLDHFLTRFARQYGRPATGFEHRARTALLAHAWPGNVREMEHVVEYAVILCPGEAVGPEHLPDYLRGREPARDSAEAESAEGDRTLAARERDLILDALAEHDWSLGRTAEALGIHRTTLWRRMKKHGI